MPLLARYPTKDDQHGAAWLNVRTAEITHGAPDLFNVIVCIDCAGQMMVVDPEWLQCPLCHEWQPINNPAVTLALRTTQLEMEL